MLQHSFPSSLKLRRQHYLDDFQPSPFVGVITSGPSLTRTEIIVNIFSLQPEKKSQTNRFNFMFSPQKLEMLTSLALICNYAASPALQQNYLLLRPLNESTFECRIRQHFHAGLKFQTFVQLFVEATFYLL